MTRTVPSLPDLITYTPGDRSTAVVFVHGFTGTAEGTWGEFPAPLCADDSLQECDVFSWGYHTEPELRNLVLRYFWTDNPSISTIASGLRTQLDHRTKNHQRLILIGHSMGGLAIQAFIVDELINKRSKHLNRLTEVVLLGTPSGGLEKAKWGALLDPQVRDMSVSGEFVRELREHWRELVDNQRADPGALARFRLTLVAGMKDQFVPETSSLNPFPLDEKERAPGNHVEMVKPFGTGAIVYHVVKERLTRGTPTREQWETIYGRSAEIIEWINYVRSAEELCDVVSLEHYAEALLNNPSMPLVDRALGLALLEIERYQTAAYLLERYLAFRLPPEQNCPFARDTQAIQQLAIALSGSGQIVGAVARLHQLESEVQNDPETQGILAGRFKRQWLKSRKAVHIGEKAREIYTSASENAKREGKVDQAFYNGINAAYMDLALGGANYRNLAQEVLDLCDQLMPRDYWVEATCGEASLLIGNFLSAVNAYRAAQKHNGLTDRRWTTTGQQALDILELLGNPAGSEPVRELFSSIRRDY